MMSVCSRPVPCSMPLAQATTGSAGRNGRGERGGDGARGLRRRGEEHQVGVAEGARVASSPQCRAGASRPADRRRSRAPARIASACFGSRAQSVTLRPARSRDERQRRAEGAGAGHGDALEPAHARAPLCGPPPTTGAAASSSGQRGARRQIRVGRRGRRRAAPRPPRRSSRHCRCRAPAAARRSGMPCLAAQRLRARARIAALAATPPATTSAVGATSGDRSRKACERSGACGPRAHRRPPPGTRRRGRRRPCRASGAIASAACRTAVFRPEKEKSQPGVALQRARQGEAARDRRRAPPARHSARRDRAGRAAWPSCRRPRRARRRWSCRAPIAADAVAPATSCVWPPETSSSR